MKEIKFRAWDNVNKRMIHFESGFLWNDEYNIWHLSGKTENEMMDVPCGNNIELMQFIGIKDKMEKEIYEGDIVQLHSKILLIDDIRNIKYFEEEFVNFTQFEMKVIGNIFENSELLKVSK